MSSNKKSGASSVQEFDFPVKSGEYFNFGYDVVDRIAAKDRNKLAMIWVNQHMAERRFTFHDFSKLSNQAANLLIKNGIVKGDRVFLMLPRLPEWWIFSLALIKAIWSQSSSTDSILWVENRMVAPFFCN